MLDEIKIEAIGGAGGNGAVSFRRERYVPRGGPDGGDGGRGGNVIIEASGSVLVLDDLRGRRTIRAEAGGNGRPGKRHGRRGEDTMVAVPIGTVVWLLDGRQRMMADLCEVGMRVRVASGGERGRGNARFATAPRRAPRIAERGLPGEHVRLRLELRLLAEVGLVGLPNAGKSSLLRAVSEARPKVGAYPFTTLEPYLGVVERPYETVVIADIPGLIEGAHEGAGLGVAFLQHIRRTRVLVHVVDVERADLLQDIEVVRRELKEFGHGLCDKPWLVALNKIDLAEAREHAASARAVLRSKGVEAQPISALTGEGVEALVEVMMDQVHREREAAAQVVQPVARVEPRPVRSMEVVCVADGFEVHGDRPAQVIAMLGVDSEEARAEVARRLRRLGVVAALRRAGVKAGDRVRIAGTELEWPL